MAKISELMLQIQQTMPVVLSGVDQDGNSFLIGYSNPQVAVVVNAADCFERKMTPQEFLEFAKVVRANSQESAITGRLDLLS